MWVSTKAQYGMRALVEVALSGDEPVSLPTAIAAAASRSWVQTAPADITCSHSGILPGCGLETTTTARGGVFSLAREATRLGVSSRPWAMTSSRAA